MSECQSFMLTSAGRAGQSLAVQREREGNMSCNGLMDDIGYKCVK